MIAKRSIDPWPLHRSAQPTTTTTLRHYLRMKRPDFPEPSMSWPICTARIASTCFMIYELYMLLVTAAIGVPLHFGNPNFNAAMLPCVYSAVVGGIYTITLPLHIYFSFHIRPRYDPHTHKEKLHSARIEFVLLLLRLGVLFAAPSVFNLHHVLDPMDWKKWVIIMATAFVPDVLLNLFALGLFQLVFRKQDNTTETVQETKSNQPYTILA